MRNFYHRLGPLPDNYEDYEADNEILKLIARWFCHTQKCRKCGDYPSETQCILLWHDITWPDPYLENGAKSVLIELGYKTADIEQRPASVP